MVQNLRDLLHRQPFEPFRVVLSSGDAYEVRHPEFAWVVKGGLYVGLPERDAGDEEAGADLPARALYCSALHIAAVEQASAT